MQKNFVKYMVTKIFDAAIIFVDGNLQLAAALEWEVEGLHI